MENQTNQTPIQEEIPNQPSKRFSVLSIVLIFIALLALFFTIFLAYKNMQLQKQIVLFPTIPSTTLQPAFDQDIPVTPTVDQKQQDNNWRTYQGETFSFQYPNSWPDAVVSQLATRTVVVIEGNLVIDDGSYFNQDLNRAMTYQEYIQQFRPSKVGTSPYALGALKGIRYADEDNAGRTAINIILSDNLNSTRIFAITHLSSGGIDTANTVLDPILATFKFK